MSILTGIGANKAAKSQAKAATASAAQAAEGQALARADILRGGANARNALEASFNDASGLWEPVLAQSDVARQAILYENGLAEAPAGYEGVQSTPGFDFLQSEGRKSILNRASGMGGVNSGAVLKELSRYQTDLDAQNYSQGYNRLLGVNNTALEARNALTNLQSNFGSNTANTFLNQATQSANTRVGQANALADGTIRAGNARAQGTQALFNIPQNFLNENLQVAGTAAEIFGNVAGGASSFVGV